MNPEHAIAFFRQCAIDIANSSSPAQRMALKAYGERAEARLQEIIDCHGRPEELGDNPQSSGEPALGDLG